ncbi:MAG: CotH kinase family protein [Verrucomicrobia bacterium]|nr:CotH kinase family protein [Verrucomicrobiota bacterium]MBI3869495.1 CotH kinase family protein [Verrucomicrobiota bacterium]
MSAHVKGRIGSHRTIDEKPSLTLDFSRYLRDQRFHGQEKIHLNNSVEDASYMNELVGSRLFGAAGIPAPRVGHAIVFLNGRRLGLYVMKESFGASFLSAAFPGDSPGTLYEPEIGHDVDESLRGKRARSGVGRENPSPSRLAEALKDPNLDSRWERTRALLDVDRFIRFMAWEVVTGHRDGYCLARNNFRLYYDPAKHRFTFLPQGMDVLFGTPDMAWKPDMAGLAARSLMERPEVQAEYRRQLEEAVKNQMDVRALCAVVDERVARLGEAVTPSERASLEEAAQSLKTRMEQRKSSLTAQLAAGDRKALTFDRGFELLTDWTARDVPDGGALRRDTRQGRPALLIEAGPRTSASWRSRVRLTPGRYRLDTEVQTLGVRALGFGSRHGVSLRRAGSDDTCVAAELSDRRWASVWLEFLVEGEGDAELLCELRASAGRAWFALDSLRLTRLAGKEPPAR